MFPLPDAEFLKFICVEGVVVDFNKILERNHVRITQGNMIYLYIKIVLPVDGGWGSWYPWERCGVTCGAGLRERRRSCDSPRPQFGGEACPGTDRQTEACDSGPCAGQFKLFIKNFCCILKSYPCYHC